MSCSSRIFSPAFQTYPSFPGPNETINNPYRRIEIIDLTRKKVYSNLQHKILNYDIDNSFKYNDYGNSNVRRK